MQLLLSFMLQVLLLASSALADTAPTPSQLSLLLWPASSPSPSPYLDLSFTSTRASILKRYPLPAFTAGDDFVRLGFMRPDLAAAAKAAPAKAAASIAWAGIAVSPASLATHRNTTVELLLTDDGTPYYVGLRPGFDEVARLKKLPGTKRNEAAIKKALEYEGIVTVEVKRDMKGSEPVLNKPVVLSKDGTVEGAEVENKSFFQKYWWAIALFFVLQVVVGGGGGDSK